MLHHYRGRVGLCHRPCPPYKKFWRSCRSLWHVVTNQFRTTPHMLSVFWHSVVTGSFNSSRARYHPPSPQLHTVVGVPCQTCLQACSQSCQTSSQALNQRVQPDLLPRWQPSLQWERPFPWPLLSMCSSSKSNTYARKSGTQSLSLSRAGHASQQAVSGSFCASFAWRVGDMNLG